jgi:DNA polymerase-3 subunit gamma/tau
MGYQVLARKWRPGTFREMVGQQHVLRALINALENDRLHHAYLFTGTRGVGKTTVARILAKCLNCESGVTADPCGECGSCREIAEGRSVDLIEVDAASRTKVEDTREILDNVQYAPTHARFKIYLIDEVHMLSNHSFNALLKTLEEPPPHAKFLLATTDPQKLPATILSRCLQFNLKNMAPDQIVEHLSHILGEESVAAEPAALGLLARAASGSMRDALSLTDQAIAFGSGALNEADVRDMLGTVDRSRVMTLAEALADNDPPAVLAAIDQIAQHAPDFGAALDELIGLLHQVTVAAMVPDAVDASWQEPERVQALAARLALDETQLFYQFALNGRRDLPLAPDPRAGFEMTCLRMLAFKPAVVIDDGPGSGSASASGGGGVSGKKPEPPARPVTSKASATPAHDTALALDSKVTATDTSRSTRAAQEAKRQVVSALSASADPAVDLPTATSWPVFFETLGLVGITQTVALHSELVAVEGRHLRFVLDEHNAGLFQEKQVNSLTQAFNQVLAEPVTLEIQMGSVGALTPAARRQAEVDARQQRAETALAEDTVLAGLLREFDAELVAGSIRPPRQEP